VINYGNRITGTADGGELLWANMTYGMGLPVTKKSNVEKEKATKQPLGQGATSKK
jgi:hypothetical protein